MRDRERPGPFENQATTITTILMTAVIFLVVWCPPSESLSLGGVVLSFY